MKKVLGDIKEIVSQNRRFRTGLGDAADDPPRQTPLPDPSAPMALPPTPARASPTSPRATLSPGSESSVGGAAHQRAASSYVPRRDSESSPSENRPSTPPALIRRALLQHSVSSPHSNSPNSPQAASAPQLSANSTPIMEESSVSVHVDSESSSSRSDSLQGSASAPSLIEVHSPSIIRPDFKTFTIHLDPVAKTKKVTVYNGDANLKEILSTLAFSRDLAVESCEARLLSGVLIEDLNVSVASLCVNQISFYTKGSSLLIASYILTHSLFQLPLLLLLIAIPRTVYPPPKNPKPRPHSSIQRVIVSARQPQIGVDSVASSMLPLLRTSKTARMWSSPPPTFSSTLLPKNSARPS